MKASQYIYFSYDGKAEHRRSYGFCTPDTYAELRRWAYSLWYDLRRRQELEGKKPKAAVWIGETRYRPTDEEIAEYDERVLKALRDDQLYKRLDSESSDAPDMEDDEEQEPAEVEEAEVEDTQEDELSEEDSEVSIMLDAEDDLDF